MGTWYVPQGCKRGSILTQEDICELEFIFISIFFVCIRNRNFYLKIRKHTLTLVPWFILDVKVSSIRWMTLFWRGREIHWGAELTWPFPPSLDFSLLPGRAAQVCLCRQIFSPKFNPFGSLHFCVSQLGQSFKPSNNNNKIYNQTAESIYHEVINKTFKNYKPYSISFLSL